jgi:hypothetical protein
LAKDRDLLVATGEEIYPPDLLPGEVPQVQKEKLQKIRKGDNTLAKVRLEVHLTESLQMQYRIKLNNTDLTCHQLLTEIIIQYSVLRPTYRKCGPAHKYRPAQNRYPLIIAFTIKN